VGSDRQKTKKIKLELEFEFESCQAIAVQQADCSKLQGRVQQSYDYRKLY